MILEHAINPESYTEGFSGYSSFESLEDNLYSRSLSSLKYVKIAWGDLTWSCSPQWPTGRNSCSLLFPVSGCIFLSLTLCLATLTLFSPHLQARAVHWPGKKREDGSWDFPLWWVPLSISKGQEVFGKQRWERSCSRKQVGEVSPFLAATSFVISSFHFPGLPALWNLAVSCGSCCHFSVLFVFSDSG